MNALVSRILRETTRAPEFLDITQETTDIVHQTGRDTG